MNLFDLPKEIGTAKDNISSPVHDWYRFTAGFSYKLVDRIILEEQITKSDIIFDSFAGCGTTLVSAQKKGIRAVGNESQELLVDVIRAKLNWDIDQKIVKQVIMALEEEIRNYKHPSKYHKLLKSLYTDTNLNQLYFIRDRISTLEEHERLFLKLALTQTLHKVSIHPIAVPYISRSKFLSGSFSGFETFKITVHKMLKDLNNICGKTRTAEIYHQDSRLPNLQIPDSSCKICITSPPYLNNLDYGEVSKVCTHFYQLTEDWKDITEKVRKHLVTGATTHYRPSEFALEDWKTHTFYKNNREIVEELLPKIAQIKALSKERKSGKSFDILILYYLEDMYKVLTEIRRVLKLGGKAYLVLGDSAPYGVHINTTELLGRIALSVGFAKFEVINIRQRGTKWKNLRYRHSHLLTENLLILK